MKRTVVLLLTVLTTSIAFAQTPPEGFILVKGGTFRMGSDRYSDERPDHEVRVSSFYLAKYEVTQKEWREVMGANPSLGYGAGDSYPVYNVSWYDAVEYCNKKSVKEGLTPCYTGSGARITCNFSATGYRLPTEAEWEFAARGGTPSKGYWYSGSNNENAVAWFAGNSGGTTHPVGTKVPNELGLYDMSGNVWELCWDRYGEYPGGAQSDPTGSSTGSDRVHRGGSWDNSGIFLRVTLRIHYNPDYRNNNLGFRVLRRPH